MPKRKRDDKGRFSKGTRDIEAESPVFLRMPMGLATDIRGLAVRLNITLSDAIKMACERLLTATDLPEPRIESENSGARKMKFRY